MNFFRVLTLMMILSVFIGTALIVGPVFAATVSFTVQPVAVAPLTDIDPSLYVLETPPTPPPTAQYFNVEIHLTNATPSDVPAGVAGVEVIFNFSQILQYAQIISFTDRLGTVGGVLSTPLLYGVNPGFFDNSGNRITLAPYTNATNYHVAAASSGGAWNGADGIVAVIQFKITGQPSSLLFQTDYVAPMALSFSSAVDGAAAPIPTGTQDGTLHIDASLPVYPPRAKIYVDPASYTGGTALGATFNYTIMMGNEQDNTGVSSFWDVTGYDITVSWNNTLITLVAYSEGGFLHQGGATTFGFYNVFPDHIRAVFVKLSDITPSSGVDSLVQLEFAVNFVGASFPPPHCIIALGPTDLGSFPHPERKFGPWFGAISGPHLPYDPNPSMQNGGTALDWTHVRVDALYTASFISPGAAIDLYDQYPAPFGGQGPNEHSDSFAPQQSVCFYAEVTYGGDRVTNKLVIFEIHNALGDKISLLQNYTDINGIATVCFRIPQVDIIPGGDDPSIFGTWNVTANVELDQVTVTDIVTFLVGWLAQVTGVDAVNAPYLKYSDIMNFTAHVLAIHEQPIQVLVSVDSYDVAGYPIGDTTFIIIIHAVRNDTGTTPVTFTYPDLMQAIPTWAKVGPASVIGYALTDFARNGGTPLCPQSPATFFTISLT